MTFRNQIAAAEKSRPSADTANCLRLLSELCGRRDAWFYPWREFGAVFVAIRQRQRRYLDGSEGLAVRADGKAAWKSSHELRQSLVATGWASAVYSGGQIASLFVTPTGDAVCRAAVGDRLFSLSESSVMLRLMRTLDGRPHCGRDWVTESDIAGRPLAGNPSDWEPLTERVLPLLVAGIATANCDVHGRVAYSVNRDAAESLPDEPVVDDIAFNPDAESWYLTAFNRERDSMRSAEPFDSAEIVIPVPVWG